MNAEYTAIVKEEGDLWIGWIEEIPVRIIRDTSHISWKNENWDGSN